MRDALDPIAPASRRLDGGLHRLGAGVHRQGRVKPGDSAKLRQERTEAVVVVGARGHREAPSLFGESGEDTWMRVAVACGRVGAHHIDIAAARYIKQVRAFAAGQHDRQRIVIVCAVTALGVHRLHDTLQRITGHNGARFPAADVAEVARPRSRNGAREECLTTESAVVDWTLILRRCECSRRLVARGHPSRRLAPGGSRLLRMRAVVWCDSAISALILRSPSVARASRRMARSTAFPCEGC